MRFPRILLAKWKLFQRHHQRLMSRPDPVLAQRKFDRRLAASRRVGAVRTGFLVALYFSFVAAAVGFVLDYLNVSASSVVEFAQAVFSSLTVVFLAGVFVCTRYLGYLEVDLYYYSVEARLALPTQ